MPIIVTNGATPLTGIASSVVGYKNLLNATGGTVTASSSSAGYAAVNIADWRPFTWWMPSAAGDSWVALALPSAQTANYFAVAAHGLSTAGSTIKLQYSTNGGASWSDATVATGGVQDRVIVRAFTAILAQHWRIFVSNPTAPAAIGIVSFGMKLDLTKAPRSGFSPAVMNRNNEYMTNESNSGLFLGRSIERRSYPGSIDLELMSPVWVRDSWEPFIDHAELKPFFFSWDPDAHSDEAVLAWTDGRIDAASYDSTITMRVSLDFNAIR